MTDEKNEEITYFERVYMDVYGCIKCGFKMSDEIYDLISDGNINYCPCCGRRICDDG